jgi:Concanavalin A-like lectin/glucanases superfamily
MIKILTTSFIALLFATLNFAQITTVGQVRYYPFTGNANDYGASSQHGIVNGATLTTDRFGNPNAAYAFSKFENDFIDLPIDGLLNDNITFSAWALVKSYPGSGNRYFFLSIGSAGGDQSLYYNNYDYDELGWQGAVYYAPSSVMAYQDKNTAVLNNWYHIVLSKSNNICRFYVNGVKIDSTVFSTNRSCYYGQATPTARIGGRYNGDKPFDGSIDDIRIYDRGLTDKEVVGLYFGESLCIDRISVTDTLIINVNLSGVNPIESEHTIKIFPNPAKDHITIDYGNYQNLSNHILKIVTPLSQTVFETTITQQQSYVNLGTWAGLGTYFVYLMDPNGNIIDVRKIILQ